MAKPKSNDIDTVELDRMKAELKELKKTGSFKEVKELQEKITALKNPNSVALLYTEIRKGFMNIRYDKELKPVEKKEKMVQHLRESADRIENSITD